MNISTVISHYQLLWSGRYLDVGQRVSEIQIVWEPGGIKQRFETGREGRCGGRAIAICGSLTAHFNFKNRC